MRDLVNWPALRVNRSIGALALLFLGLLPACNDDGKKTAGSTSLATANSVAKATPSSAPSVPMNATPLPAASIAMMLNADNLPPYNGPVGSVEGTITVTGDPAPANNRDFTKCPAAAKAYGKLFREGASSDAGGRALADALVGVIGYSGFYVPERNEARRVTIEDCALTPRTVDLTFGQRLEIQNKTTLLFAPQLEGVFSPALMIAPPGADPVKIYPQRPGYFPVTDKMGNDFFSGDVYVLLHPLHTVSGLDGHYRIDGLPVGKVKVFTRLRVIGETEKPVEILAGVVSHVDLTLNYAAPSAKDAGKNASVAPQQTLK